ncbi:hypothetical protein AHAS_Ahas06G0145000 [Arachis hypogaea]
MSYNYANVIATLDHLLHDTSNNSFATGFDFIEELIRAADCFDTNHLHVAHVIRPTQSTPPIPCRFKASPTRRLLLQEEEWVVVGRQRGPDGEREREVCVIVGGG